MKTIFSALGVSLLIVVGGCGIQPSNPLRAANIQTDFRHLGSKELIRSAEDIVVGSWREIKGLDRSRLHIVGRYVQGETFNDGILTYQLKDRPMRIPFLAALEGMKVGGRRRVVINIQLLEPGWEKPYRFVSFANPEMDDDSFRFRIDKGDVEFDVEVLDSCTPYEYEIVRNGFIGGAFDLGCW